MANVAVIFHWPPQAMFEMDVSELIRWHEKARARSGADQSHS